MIQLISTAILSLFIHTHHVSVCEMTYKEEAQAIEIVQNVFADDLELAIKTETGNQSFDINAENEVIDEQIKAFAAKHIKVTADDQVLKHEWYGFKIEGNNLEMYVKLEGVTATQLHVTNSIFLHLLSRQKNIIHFSHGDKKITEICTKRKPTTHFDLKSS